ncbi:MAG: hypothetical protein IJB94_00825 [Clostridia bacterium]|nr:hypothetical protein [Clostridia bacterium]
MENLQITPKLCCRRIHRCGTEVLRIITPNVTGTTPAATHTAALIEALVRHAEDYLADHAEHDLREAIAKRALLRFMRHEIHIILTAKRGASCLCLSLSYTHKSGNTVHENGTLCTYWSNDESIQYRRPPRRNRKASAISGQKRISLFSRATLRTRAKCDKI